MSIILEALKKASVTRKAPPLAAGTAAGTGGEKIDTEKNEAHDDGFNLSRTMFMAAAAIISVGLVAFLTHPQSGMKNVTGDTNIKTVAEGYSTVPLPAAPKQETTPIGSFITKLSNPRLALSGIVYGAGKPAAIINNKILEEGASIRGAKIVKIHNNSVEMLDEVTGQDFVLKLD
jgi:hypothetical protein